MLKMSRKECFLKLIRYRLRRPTLMSMVGSRDTGYFRSKERCYGFGYKGEVPINTP